MGAFAGDLARRRAKFVPGEAAAKVVQTKEPSHKDDFDEWLARIKRTTLVALGAKRT